MYDVENTSNEKKNDARTFRKINFYFRHFCKKIHRVSLFPPHKTEKLNIGDEREIFINPGNPWRSPWEQRVPRRRSSRGQHYAIPFL